MKKVNYYKYSSLVLVISNCIINIMFSLSLSVTHFLTLSLISDPMQALCKNHFLQFVYRKIDGAILWSQNERNLNCVITFQTHSILQRFMLRFDMLQLDCNDHLFIYDGAHTSTEHKVSKRQPTHIAFYEFIQGQDIRMMRFDYAANGSSRLEFNIEWKVFVVTRFLVANHAFTGIELVNVLYLVVC